MTQYNVTWTSSPEIQPKDLDKVCRQVYVWIVTEDNRIVIVSKDNKQWQLPGGKPEAGETLIDTAIREVREETGLEIESVSDDLQFFGYQIVQDIDSDDPPYLQVRYLLKLDSNAANLALDTRKEDANQPERDSIKFVTASDEAELVKRIPWMNDSAEFTTVKSLALS